MVIFVDKTKTRQTPFVPGSKDKTSTRQTFVPTSEDKTKIRQKSSGPSKTRQIIASKQLFCLVFHYKTGQNSRLFWAKLLKISYFPTHIFSNAFQKYVLRKFRFGVVNHRIRGNTVDRPTQTAVMLIRPFFKQKIEF